MMETSESTIQFIEIVKAHPVLYDETHPEFRKPKHDIWNKIGKMFETDGEILRTKWSNLKKGFGRYIKILNANPESQCKPWPYLKHMNFYNFVPKPVSYRQDDYSDCEDSVALEPIVEVNVVETEPSQDESTEEDMSSRRSTRIEKRKQLGKTISYSNGTGINEKNDIFDSYYDKESNPPKRAKLFSSTPKQAVTRISTPDTTNEMPVLEPVEPEKEEPQTSIITNTEENTEKASREEPCNCNTVERDNRRKNFTPLELIFMSYAKILEGFSPKQQVLTKMKIADIILKEELVEAQLNK